MHVNIGNALAETSPVGVPKSALERLDERVARAHQRIQTGRREGETGYVALDLPDTTDPGSIEEAVGRLADAETLLTIGIGGSSLGGATLARALDGDRETIFLDNIDPAETRALIESLDLRSTALNVVSRSGTTAETLANFLVIRDAMTDAGVDWTERTLVTTGESGNLRRLADTNDLPVLDVPSGVPGRFSALSPVGLASVAFQGNDVEAILEGAQQVADGLSGSLFESSAYAYGATMYALTQRGLDDNAMMPYAEALEPFAEWFAQLWAESLGKDRLGQTPLRALGATDQHSQLQLYRAGPLDKVITLVRVRDRPRIDLPATELEGLEYLHGSSLGELLGAEFEATEASLAESGVPNVRLEIESVDERGMGELLYAMEAACILVGELFGIDTFTQPAVEWGKSAARSLLRGEERLPEHPDLVVED